MDNQSFDRCILWLSLHLGDFLKNGHLSLDLKKDYNNFSLSIWHMQTGKLKKPLNNLVSPYKWEKFGNLSIEISRSGKISQHLWGEPNLSPITYGESRRYKSFKSLVANLPPSSGTSGRRSGGITGIASRIIHSGDAPDWINPWVTLRRLANFFFICLDLVQANKKEVG